MNVVVDEWVELTDTIVDLVNNTASATTSHFTQFAILTRIVEEAPVVVPTPTSDPVSTPAKDNKSPVNAPLITGLIIVAIAAIGTLPLVLPRRRGKDRNRSNA